MQYLRLGSAKIHAQANSQMNQWSSTIKTIQNKTKTKKTQTNKQKKNTPQEQQYSMTLEQ